MSLCYNAKSVRHRRGFFHPRYAVLHNERYSHATVRAIDRHSSAGGIAIWSFAGQPPGSCSELAAACMKPSVCSGELPLAWTGNTFLANGQLNSETDERVHSPWSNCHQQRARAAVW